MSSHKRKAVPSTTQPQETFNIIIGVTARVKPKLADLRRKDARHALLDDLQHLAVLGETLTEQRQRGKISGEVADTLDREGVHLWNVSSLVRNPSDCDEDQSLFAALRLAGFRLIEAGIEQKPGVETLINVLQLASKTGTALSDSGRNDIAASVLGCAAKFEEQLRNSEDATNTHDQAKARAVVLYYCSRMLTAWRDGNDAIAQFMLEKITENDEKRLSLITIPDRELLAVKILEIGKSILKACSRTPGDGDARLADSKRAQDAVRWIRKAFALVEKMEDSESSGMAVLKRGILRSLARAYYLSSSIEAENLVRAETTLQELIASIDNSTDNANPEHHQLRWMRLAVLKKRKAPELAMQEAFVSIVDHTIFTESEVTDILQELRTLSHQHKLVSDVLQRCIERLLDGPAENANFVDRFLLSLLSHCSRDQEHSRAIKSIETGCSSLTASEFELERAPAMACLITIWKVGDRHYQMKKWSQAADWFLTGTHKAFASIAQLNSTKCFRKAALCYVEQREYARASQIIQRCPSGQSSTFYLLFLTAVYQGLEEDAVSAVQDMANAPDFDRKMLLLATQLAHESDLKSVLLAALEALLKTLQSHGPMDSDVEAILLARCIIRLVIRLMKETSNEKDRMFLVSSLIRHFRTGEHSVILPLLGKTAPFIAKDVSWLWRTAYNAAVQGCSDWEHAESQIADLFDISYELVCAYSRIAVANTEADVYIHTVYAAFSCVSARSTRSSLNCRWLDIRRAKETITSVKERIGAGDHLESDNLDELLHTVQVFEAEIYCQRLEWDKLLGIINELESITASLVSYEAIADMLWSESDCPVNVLYVALEALLHACLNREALSVDKFSRWLRAICAILLSRNSQTDRTKAISYVEQALAVLEDHSDSSESGEQVYPMDERQWLLGTAYNTGVECLAASYLDEAKRWFEAATVICGKVTDGARHSERISNTYRQLLEQYAPHPV
ncbi:meiosis protein SPO22/ZIP4 like-domain-containing protein [Phellopilus nigrolimitatus]|nr:meiosis protein SPO22/ZIP4 like-domain-containing protein [Phellopilus nigrolimitatus]